MYESVSITEYHMRTLVIMLSITMPEAADTLTHASTIRFGFALTLINTMHFYDIVDEVYKPYQRSVTLITIIITVTVSYVLLHCAILW